MRLEQLKYFYEVATWRSMKLAAENLYITQPAISVGIKNLEEELGVTLFLRSKNEVQLTSIGEMLLDDVKNILKSEKNMFMIADTYKNLSETEIVGELSIAYSSVVMNTWFQEILYGFSQRNKKIKLQTIETTVKQAIDIVLEYKADCGIAMFSDEMLIGYKNRGINFKYIYSEKIYLVCHKAYGFSGLTSIRQDEIRDLPFVSFSESPVINEYKVDGISHSNKNKCILNTYSFDLIKQFVINGRAVVLLPGTMIQEYKAHKDMDVIPIIGIEPGRVCFYYRKDSKKADLLALLEFAFLK